MKTHSRGGPARQEGGGPPGDAHITITYKTSE